MYISYANTFFYMNRFPANENKIKETKTVCIKHKTLRLKKKRFVTFISFLFKNYTYIKKNKLDTPAM